jgi:hypothetical protein
MKMTSSKRVFAVALAAALLAPAAALAANPSAEDFATARALYKEGKELRAAGKLDAALEKLKAAHALGRTPLTGIELARTQAQLNLLVEARETCLGIARLPVESDETARSAEARQDAAKLAQDLRPRIASLRLHVSTQPPAQVIVAIDGATVPSVALAESRMVNPGHHVVTAHVEGGATVSATADVGEGQTGDVQLAPPPAPVVVQPRETHETAPPEMRPKRGGLGGVIIAGITITSAGVVVGAIGGLVAIAGKNSLANECQGSGCPIGQASNDLDAAKSAALASTIGFTVAGVGLVMLVVGLATHTTPKESLRGVRIVPDVGFGQLGVHGAF